MRIKENKKTKQYRKIRVDTRQEMRVEYRKMTFRRFVNKSFHNLKMKFLQHI